MAAAQETVARFHQKCHSLITLSDNNTTAAGSGIWGAGTVFSPVPLHQLHNNRFVFKTNKQVRGTTPVCYIGVTRSDPGDLEEIPWLAREVPQTWCVGPPTGARWENSRKVDTGKVTGVTQQAGDVWCVEVTPGGQVYIYHNYNQPCGSPVFTLPPDTTQVWAAVTLRWDTTISVVQNPDTVILGYDTITFLYSLLDNKSKDNHNKITEEYISHITPMISKSNPETTQAVYYSVVRFCTYENVSCTDLRRLLVTGNVIEIMKRLALIMEVSIAGLLFTCLRELGILPGFITYDKELFLKWGESEHEFLLDMLTFINQCGNTQNILYLRDVDSMLGLIVKCIGKEGDRINKLDDKGWAPLHYTAHFGLSLATQELLRNQDIDVNLKNQKGDTPLHLAIKSISKTASCVSTNYLDTCEALKSHHAIDIHPADSNHMNTFLLLFLGMKQCHLDQLTDRNVLDLSWKDKIGRTLVDYSLETTDELGWNHIRPFISGILKNTTWTGYKLLSDGIPDYSASKQSPGSEAALCYNGHCDISVDVTSMDTVEWLLALNQAIHIPGHTQQSPVYQRDVTQGIGRTDICYKCLVQSIEVYTKAESYALKAKEVLQGKFPDLLFELQAIGSYIQDLKILKADEYDFLFIIKKAGEDKGNMCDDAQKYGATWFAEQSELVQKGEHSDTSIISIYPHGPAWCLEFTRNEGEHACVISVDITLAVRHVGDPMQEYCKKIEVHPYYGYVFKNISEDALFVNLGPDKHGLTSCTIMMKLIARLSYKLPHVATVIRIVKLMVGLLLPKRIIYCESKHSKLEAKNLFSSHTIMSLVLRYLDASIDKTDCWSTEQLPSTVGAVMKMLSDKLLTTEQDYLVRENIITEMDIFGSIDLFLKGGGLKQRQFRSISDTFTSYFAIVKVGSFVKFRTEKELIELCRPLSISADRPTVLAYVIPDHPLLQADSKYQTLSQLMCLFRSYLYNKFTDLPVRE